MHRSFVVFAGLLGACKGQTCGDTGAGAAFECLHGDVNDASAVDEAITATAENQGSEQGTCCVKPTCGNSDGAGTAFNCAGDAASATDKDNAYMVCADDLEAAKCCVEPTCGSTDGAGTKFDCTGADVFKNAAEHSTTVDQATCCTPATCGAAVTGVDVIVTIGGSGGSNPKCVDHSDAAQLSCDPNAAQAGKRVCTDCSGSCYYADEFTVTTTDTQVCAERTNGDSWGMDLKIKCQKTSAFDCAGDQTSSTDVYNSAAAAETTVDAATCCKEPQTETAAAATNATNGSQSESTDGCVRATAVFAVGAVAAHYM